MIATFQALAVFLTSILPGSLFTFQYERENARLTTTDFNERLMVFLGTSAVFGVLSTPLLYEGYRRYIVTGDLERGEPLPVWFWLIVAGYVIIPLAVGAAIGIAARKRHWLARPFTGPQPDPRGWDALLKTPKLGGYVKLLLKDEKLTNRWVMGLWGTGPVTGTPSTSVLPTSYAAGYPYEQDFYFSQTYMIAEDGGHFEDPPGSGFPVPREAALLVRWDEVAYAEFIEG